MAKQDGIVFFTGTIGGLNFYMHNGKHTVRIGGGGFDSEKIKKEPSMVRVRENGSEFGNSSRVKKVFKDALSLFFNNLKDGKLNGRLMSLFTKLKDNDLISERGKRNVLEGLKTSIGKKLLLDFSFSSMEFPYQENQFVIAGERLTLENLNSNRFDFNNNATHIELCFAQLELNVTALKAKLYKSDSVLLPKGFAGTDLEFEIETPIIAAEVSVAVFYYRYIQEINGSYYPFNNGTSFGLKVLEVTNT